MIMSLLNAQRLTEVVDIGANPIDGDPPYRPMLQAGLCRVTGFEPQEEALASLQLRKGANERYFPYVIGDGGHHSLYICEQSGLTSLLEPDPHKLAYYSDLEIGGVVSKRIDGLQTQRLDDIEEIDRIDLLKIDVQGSELAIFQNGQKRLSSAVAIQTEVAFLTIYKNQPTLGDIDVALRALGFIPHTFIHAKAFVMNASSPVYRNNALSGQLLDGDAELAPFV